MEVAPIPEEQQQLTDALKGNYHLFATGDSSIQTAALTATKSLFDSALSQENEGLSSIKRFVQSLVADMNHQPRETRAQKLSRANAADNEAGPSIHPKMRGMVEAADRLEPTPLSELYVNGMGIEQIWSQLELRAKNICDLVDLVFEGEHLDPETLLKDDSDEAAEADEMEVDDEDWDMEDDGGGDEDEEEEEEESSEGEDLGEHIMTLSGEAPKPKQNGPTIDLDRANLHQSTRKRKGPKHPVLDDDFFSIQEFNREIEGAEARSSSRGRLKRAGSDDEEEEDNESVDLFADVGEEAEDNGSDGDGAPIMYSDFFEPPSAPARVPGKRPSKTVDSNTDVVPESPPSKTSKVRFHDEVRVKMVKNRRKADTPNATLLEDDTDEEDEDEMEQWMDEDEGDSEVDSDEEEASEGSEADVMERAKDDLFADDEEPQTDLSTFAQRQLALKQQIEELERENVAQKEWTMIGEANSRARPLNSLLEEDLEFEHRQRVVPIITEEKVKSLEEIIKARIIEGRYDDVVRRRALDDKPFLPSRLFELQDTKSAQSLAQIYEDEYTAASSGGVVDDRDGKLKKEHEELEAIWEGIANKLDALCNAHFTPKSAKGVISVVSNLPSTTMESALPTAKTASSLLAPEEVFSTTAPGVIASREEMTPEEKQALRMKNRKKRMKMRKTLDASVDKYSRMNKGQKPSKDGEPNGGKKGKKAQEKEEKARALKSIVKTGRGVTVVGK